jgi:hypothetical protein
MSTSRAQDGSPEPGEHDYPLHLLAGIPGISPWALLHGNYAGLQAALYEARQLADEHGWTIHVNDRHSVHWRTCTPPGRPARESGRGGKFAVGLSGLALQAGEPDPAEAATACSLWRVHPGPTPYKQRTLADGFAGRCAPDPQDGDGGWSWVITDPYTGGRLSSGAAAGQGSAEQAIADWEAAYAGGAYDPVADLALLIARSIQQLPNCGLGADATTVLRRLCHKLGISSDEPAAMIEARLRSRIVARRTGPVQEAGQGTAASVYSRCRYPAGPCGTCRGTGAKPGTSPRICSACDGAGRRPDLIWAGNPERCEQCCGRGLVVDDPCPDCSGSGQAQSGQSPSAI